MFTPSSQPALQSVPGGGLGKPGTCSDAMIARALSPKSTPTNWYWISAPLTDRASLPVQSSLIEYVPVWPIRKPDSLTGVDALLAGTPLPTLKSTRVKGPCPSNVYCPTDDKGCGGGQRGN